MVAGTQVFYRLSGSKWCFDDLYATGSALMFDNSDWNWKYGNMDSRFSENSAKYYLASLYATKFNNSACNACGSISVLSGINLTSF